MQFAYTVLLLQHVLTEGILFCNHQVLKEHTHLIKLSEKAYTEKISPSAENLEDILFRIIYQKKESSVFQYLGEQSNRQPTF